MEAPKAISAEDELRRKLQEYLAAKGKLKPQNNQKTYLKDSTNLQAKSRQLPPKQAIEKKDVPLKSSRYGPETNKKTTSSTGLLQNKATAGKVPAQQNVLPKKVDYKPLAKNPSSLKENLPRVKPGLLGQAVQSKNVNLKDKLLGRKSSFTVPQKARTEAEVGLTVVLTKSQLGDKTRVSDVHMVAKRGSETSDVKGTTEDPEQQMLHQPSVEVSVKSQVLPSKPSKPVRQETKSSHPTGKTMATTRTGHIRVVSRVSQALSNSDRPSERSFLIKSARIGNNVQPRRPPTMRMEQGKCPVQKLGCATKPNTTIKSTTSVTTQNKVCPHPLSTSKTVRSTSAHTSDKALPVQSRPSVSKPALWQKNTKMSTSDRTVPRTQIGNTNCTKGTGSKSAVTSTTNQTQTSKSSSLSSMTATDATSKPHTPKMTVEDRRKKLQEWLSSKGKTYKRPPMTLPPKRPPTVKKKPNPNSSVWEGIEAEEELFLLSQKISQTLAECLELIAKGVSSEDIHAALDKIPEGKKFAKYWVCKAKLLEREGIYDVVELYKQGVQCGATPIDELREVIFDIMKNTNRKSKVVTFGPLPNEDTAVDSEQYEKDVHATPVIKPADDVEASCFDMGVCDQGSAVKFQVACLSSKKKKDRSSQEWKCLTPVRRSLRIHQSASQYPEVVQEHDTVVGSLDELLDKADTEAYLYVRNEALPEEADHPILSMVKQDSSEGQNERPV